MHPSEALVRAYYDAFNRGDWEGMCALLAPDVAHDPNQGVRETGVAAFRAFLERMARCYREELRDVFVMLDASGSRAAAEFTVHGEYLADDAGLPPARGQRYELPAGAFLELRAGRITRVSMHYNLADWVAQVR
jgi:steroid delta-isomerase-like uncharacterized protein